MRDYFRHTAAVSHIATRFVGQGPARATARRGWSRCCSATGWRTAFTSGRRACWPRGAACELLRGDLTAIVRLVDLANLYDKPIAAATWEVDSARTPAGCRRPCRRRRPAATSSRCWAIRPGSGRCCAICTTPGILERFIPEFHHARGLLQFNQYHKYTVDEHCLRAVEFATEFWSDTGPLGRVYRPLAQKHLLHLALLIHDLGKGRLEDHREVGVKIAADAARRLGLPAHETEALRFLVHKHMLMNHLAFRRDTADEQLAVQFAVQVGSPELLQMLYVLTAADLGAVGPDVWDGWKLEVVTDLYHRTMQHLAGESPETTIDDLLGQRREAVRGVARHGERRRRGSPSTSTPCRPPISTPRRPNRLPPICACCTAFPLSLRERARVRAPAACRSPPSTSPRPPRSSSPSPLPNRSPPGIFHGSPGP